MLVETHFSEQAFSSIIKGDNSQTKQGSVGSWTMHFSPVTI